MITGTEKTVPLHASNFDVFISYSRGDQPFVRRLYEALGEKQRRAWVDWEGIPPTADWLREVFAAIEAADTFVFVLSAASLTSNVCLREVEHAMKCRKRLVPLAWGQVDAAKAPAELARLNWIVCCGDDDFPGAIDKLLAALTIDLEWVREHTRLLVRAVDWRDGRADTSLLLRGADLREAELWLSKGADKEPKPTELHRDYVITSRAQETQRSRRTLSVVAAGLVLAIALAVVAWMQRQAALAERKIADQRRIEADRQSVVALTNESAASLILGREIEALIAAVRAGQKLKQELELQDASTSVYRTLIALRRAIYEGHELNRIDTGAFRGVTHLSFSPDGKSIYSSGGQLVQRWSTDGRLLSSLQTDHSGLSDGCTYINNFAISPDGKTIATIGNEGGFALWRSDGGRTSGFDLQVVRAGDGMCTGIVSSKVDFASRTVTVREEEQESVWSFAGQSVTRTPIAPPTDDVRAGRVEVTSADGSLISKLGTDRALTVRRRNGEVVLREQRMRSPALSPHNDMLATVSDDVDNGVIHLWDLTSRTASPPESAMPHDAHGSKKTVNLGGRPVALDSAGAFNAVAVGRSNGFAGVLSPDNRFAAVTGGTNGGSLALWRLTENATGASSALVKQFDAEQLASADFTEALESLTFSPDSKLLASGGSDGTVKLWDLDGKLVRKILAHGEYANARFSPDGHLLLTWGVAADGEVAVKLWSVDGELLDSLSNQAVVDAWFSGDSHWILAVREASNKKEAWMLDLDDLVRKGCDMLRLYLANPAMHKDASLCPAVPVGR